MAYATSDDIFSRYKPIRTMVGASSFEVASIDVTSIFIHDAESLVDAYVGIKYATPITPVSGLVTQITSDLTIFAMLAEKHINVPDQMQARYDRSISLLEMIRDGKMTLGSSVSVNAGGDEEAWSSNQDFHSIFSPVLDELEQAVDDDMVEAERNDRASDAGGVGRKD